MELGAVRDRNRAPGRDLVDRLARQSPARLAIGVFSGVVAVSNNSDKGSKRKMRAPAGNRRLKKKLKKRLKKTY